MSKSELRELLSGMRKAMKESDGVGLAANQIGISSRFFVAEFDRKFYEIFNPEIVSFSKTKPKSLIAIVRVICSSVSDFKYPIALA